MSISFYSYKEPETEGAEVEWIDGPNFANGNAAMIVRALGLPDFDYGGSWDLDEFEAAVLIAQAVPPVEDDGQPSVRNGNMISCGVRPGYFADAFAALGDLAAECRKAGVDRVRAA